MIVLHNDNEPLPLGLKSQASLVAEMSYANGREYYRITKSIRMDAPLDKRITPATLDKQVRWVINATRRF